MGDSLSESPGRQTDTDDAESLGQGEKEGAKSWEAKSSARRTPTTIDSAQSPPRSLRGRGPGGECCARRAYHESLCSSDRVCADGQSGAAMFWRKRSRDRQRSTRRREAGAERGRGIRGSPCSRACGKRDSPLPPQVHDMISWFWLRRGLHKDERGRKRVARPKKRRQGDHLHAAAWARPSSKRATLRPLGLSPDDATRFLRLLPLSSALCMTRSGGPRQKLRSVRLPSSSCAVQRAVLIPPAELELSHDRVQMRRFAILRHQKEPGPASRRTPKMTRFT